MNNQKYFIGLDIGTDSLGFCATDIHYNAITKSKKTLMGTRLFDAGTTAVERRVLRSNRRRLVRRKERIALLQDLFREEIAKVDDGFFLRLKESMYHYDDKTEIQYNALFNDANYTDKEYHDAYKTIYHLRKALCNGEVQDVRLLYLGVEHILKNRGHFLFEGESMDAISQFQDVYTALDEVLNDGFDDLKLDISDIDALEAVLKNNKLTISAKETAIKNLVSGKASKEQTHYIKLIVGGSADLKTLFGEENLEEELLKTKLSFRGDYEKFVAEIQPKLDDDMVLVIEVAKALYDWSLLVEILDCPDMNQDSTLSDAMMYKYEIHKADLKVLKEMVKKYIPHEYKEIFVDYTQKHNYSAYVGSSTIPLEQGICSCEDFCKYIKKKFKDFKEIALVDPRYLDIQNKLDMFKLLPKQRMKDNGVIPNQVHFMELVKILEKNQSNFPFLQAIDSQFDITVSEKIMSIFKYRIPYYVGVLNSHSDAAWIVRKDEKIYPWNFKDVVDLEQSAENFIRRMTNQCTYLKDADVLPKHSLLYSKFEVLNELNNLKLNGEPITVALKQELFDQLFMKHKKITNKRLKDYLLKHSHADKDVVITGIDVDFKSSLESHITFHEILGDDFDEDMVEDIILWIGLFAEDSDMLFNKINTKYRNHGFTELQQKRIKTLKFKGFGRLSKEFLSEIEVPNQDGEILNIINFMYETNNNLMKVLSSEYAYIDIVNDKNKKENSNTITLDDIRDLYCSPTVKRGMWQVVQVVQEIEKIMGCPPAKLFIETTRAEGEKVATKSRKKDLEEKYKKGKLTKEYIDIYNALTHESMDDGKLRQKKLYLYFTQLGRCAYTGESINIADLNNHNLYDIEHIYPRSLTKDDSIHQNLVLVKRTANADKSDIYPIPVGYRQTDLWTLWHSKNLITKEKYDRLTRTTEFEPKELQGFIARQLVETSQTSKAIANLFKNYYVDKESKVVYVKAGNVSAFRQHFDFVKVRDVNDYHHAQDAYLNIVVGNVWDTKFTEKFFKTVDKTKYNLKPDKLYAFDVKKGEYFAWQTENTESLKTVKGVMANHKLLFTRRTYKDDGALFKQNPLKKGKGGIPVKNPHDKDLQYSKLSDLNKYGGYTGIQGSYFVLVKYETGKKKKKDNLQLVQIPIYIVHLSKQDNSVITSFIQKEIKCDEFEIIIKEVKKNTLIKINGFQYHLSGGKDVKNAIQLILSNNSNKYIKKLNKYCSDIIVKAKKDKLPLTDLGVPKYISSDENLELYDAFINKIGDSIFNKSPYHMKEAEKLTTVREKFESLSIPEQCDVLMSILTLFQCKPSSRPKNLSLIGCSGEAYRFKISTSFNKYHNVSIIHQSVTGFFENEHIIIKDGQVVNEKGRRR